MRTAVFELKFSFDAVVRILLFEFFIFLDSTYVRMFFSQFDSGYSGSVVRLCLYTQKTQDLFIDKKDSESGILIPSIVSLISNIPTNILVSI